MIHRFVVFLQPCKVNEFFKEVSLHLSFIFFILIVLEYFILRRVEIIIFFVLFKC